MDGLLKLKTLCIIAAAVLIAPGCQLLPGRAPGPGDATPARPEALDILARSIGPRSEKYPPPELDKEKGWQQRAVNELSEAYPYMRAAECLVTIRDDDSLCALVTLAPYPGEWNKGKPARKMILDRKPDMRLVWLVPNDKGKVFHSPNLERPVGANRLRADRLRADGLRADRLPPFSLYHGERDYPGGASYDTDIVQAYVDSGAFPKNPVSLYLGAP
jgi:hypothetical protein